MHADPLDWGTLAAEARDALSRIETLSASVKYFYDGRAVTNQIWFSSSRWRIESPTALTIYNGSDTLTVRDALGTKTSEHDSWIPGEELGFLGWGHPELFLDPPEFRTQASKPAPGSTVAGRATWFVRLPKARRKPVPLDVWFDVETQLPLKSASPGLDFWAEVVELTIGEELTDSRFKL